MIGVRALAFCFAAVLLGGCQTAQPSLNMSVGAIKIESIKVSIETAIPPDSNVAQRLVAFTTYRLQKQSAPAGKPVNVGIQITQFHRKNPVASLLIGDSNRFGALVTLSDGKGAVLSKRELFAANSMIVNGIIGAVAAAASEKTETDDALADDLAGQIERSIFGRAGAGAKGHSADAHARQGKCRIGAYCCQVGAPEFSAPAISSSAITVRQLRNVTGTFKVFSMEAANLELPKPSGVSR
jgi:hypothetical protein